MAISKANATWEGTLKDGKGIMRPEHADPVPFSVGTRFEGQTGSNPEEMIGAALAGCFSMALSLGLEQAGAPPRNIQTAARVRIEKQGDGFTITAIELSTEVSAPGIEDARFQQVAEETKSTCPVSKALAAVERIELTARLV
ncbi:MAG: OsmC family peroxiredoxin [Candidatus Krumholzibacteriia bacterium]